MHNEHGYALGYGADRGEIFAWIVRGLGYGWRYCDRQVVGKKQRVTVGGRSDHLVHTDHAAGAIAHFHDNRHAPEFRKLLRRDPRQDVRWRRRRERDYKPHRSGRKGFLRAGYRWRKYCDECKGPRKQADTFD